MTTELLSRYALCHKHWKVNNTGVTKVVVISSELLYWIVLFCKVIMLFSPNPLFAISEMSECGHDPRHLSNYTSAFIIHQDQEARFAVIQSWDFCEKIQFAFHPAEKEQNRKLEKAVFPTARKCRCIIPLTLSSSDVSTSKHLVSIQNQANNTDGIHWEFTIEHAPWKRLTMLLIARFEGRQLASYSSIHCLNICNPRWHWSLTQ